MTAPAPVVVDTLAIGRAFEHSIISEPEIGYLDPLQEALFAAVFVSLAASGFALFPGHADSRFWPLYVEEHFGPRNSQHLLDPYSFVHFGHGIVSFYLFDDPRRNEQENFMNPGLIKTLFAALSFEMLENTEMLIDLFRENSGTSGKIIKNRTSFLYLIKM